MTRWLISLLLTILAFSLISCAVNTPTDTDKTVIRGITWEDTFNEVVDKEKALGAKISLTDTSVHAENVEIFGQCAESICYVFEDDSLSVIRIYYGSHTSDQEWKDEFNSIIDVLKEEYGDPLNNNSIKAQWSTELFSVEAGRDFWNDRNYIYILKQ